MLESIMEAVQSLSSRMLTLESSRNSTDPSRESRPLFDRSHDAVVHSSSPPAGPSRGLRVGKGFPGGPPDPIDQGGEGSDDDEEELISESPSHASEREIVDSRALLHTKLEVVPQSAADFRAWKTNFFLMLGRLDISSNEYLSKWAATAFEVGQEKECQSSSGLIPRFDRWLASELLKNVRSSPELLFKVQGYVERCTRQSTVPRGRMILYMIARHFDLDRTRGSLLTSQSIFQVELNGFSLKDLQEFSGTVMKTLNSIDPADWPNQRMLGEWLFHRLRNVRKLERTIDEIKRSAYSSELRDFDFLWGRLQEHLVEEREDTNARSIELSLKPKSWKKDPKEKPNPPANPAKAATVPPPPPKETPAAPADPSSSKSDPKALRVKVAKVIKARVKRGKVKARA